MTALGASKITENFEELPVQVRNVFSWKEDKFLGLQYTDTKTIDVLCVEPTNTSRLTKKLFTLTEEEPFSYLAISSESKMGFYTTTKTTGTGANTKTVMSKKIFFSWEVSENDFKVPTTKSFGAAIKNSFGYDAKDGSIIVVLTATNTVGKYTPKLTRTIDALSGEERLSIDSIEDTTPGDLKLLKNVSTIQIVEPYMIAASPNENSNYGRVYFLHDYKIAETFENSESTNIG